MDYINAHLISNSDFLMDKDLSMNKPFNFIGDLYNLEDDLPQIIMPLVVDPKLKGNYSALREWLIVKRSRAGDNQYEEVKKFDIKGEELMDTDIANICKIYWLDYMCFPFQVPIECDLEQIIREHYGVDVEYKPCY